MFSVIEFSISTVNFSSKSITKNSKKKFITWKTGGRFGSWEKTDSRLRKVLIDVRNYCSLALLCAIIALRGQYIFLLL